MKPSERIREWLTEQGRPAILHSPTGKSCLYRLVNEDGEGENLCCVVGSLIPDFEYLPAFEGAYYYKNQGLQEVLHGYWNIPSELQRKFDNILAALQDVHDDCQVDDFSEEDLEKFEIQIQRLEKLGL